MNVRQTPSVADNCGCREGNTESTPLPTANQPGLDALRYRVGTHGAFFESMLTRLSSSQYPKLGELTTRQPSDASIALLDAWATVADVLSFYNERIVNEGYLRTASERRSLAELARLVGYTPRPGVAASAYLAYTLEETNKDEVVIPAGARVQSVPAQGELPQTFETSVALQAYSRLNNLKPRLTRPQSEPTIKDTVPHASPQQQRVYLKGVNTNLKVNDMLLIDFGDNTPIPYRAIDVTPDATLDRTRVLLRDWQEVLFSLDSKNFVDANGLLELSDSLRNEFKKKDKPLSDEASVATTREPNTWVSKSAGTNFLIRNENEKLNVYWQASDNPAAPKISVDNLLSPLSQLPSLPPINEFRLERSPNRSFATTANAPLQMLSAFQPRLRETWFPAIANAHVTPENPIKVYALRVKASLFGHNAPREPQYNKDSFFRTPLPQPWAEWTQDKESPNALFLDRSYREILPGSTIVIQNGEKAEPQVSKIANVQLLSRHAYGIGGETTKITLAGTDKWWDTKPESTIEPIRQTIVYAQTEELLLAEEPIVTPICGKDPYIELDSLYDGLQPGRWLIVSGERQIEGTSGVKDNELVMLAAVTHSVAPPGADPVAALSGDKQHTYIQLATPLSYCYKRDTVTIYGNVVKATHGETRNEVLGSGEGSKDFQAFALKQAPLTYVAAVNPTGVDSTLVVRVNEVEWQEAASLDTLGRNDRNFITKTNDDGKTTVVFGNGEQGARLPTGLENVKALYRNGIGKAGNLQRGQLSMLMTRPLGVKEVNNPLPATGGADKDSPAQIRKNTTLALLALDRLVSVRDYEDFARSFAGVGKASAIRLSDGRRQMVHVTIAGVDDVPIDETSDLFRALRQALHTLGDPYQPMQLAVRELLLLVLSAKVRLLAGYQWETVAPNIRIALLDAFGFERRALGEDVHLSEAIWVIQQVNGVAYVDVDAFDALDKETIVANLPKSGTAPQSGTSEIDLAQRLALRPPPHLSVSLARLDTTVADPTKRLRPAQIAYLSSEIPETIILNLIEG